ncbi:Fungal specific transcription factor domain-containing protein [Cladophialophora immunda]|nr:Fungal specific transcription factor domain-containing protein [Cladophialophora immunda]
MFITYNDLDDMRDARKRSQINAYVNRGRRVNKVKSSTQRPSRPPLQWQARHPIRTSTPAKVEPELLAQAKHVADIRDPHVTEEIIYALLKRRRLPKLSLQYGLGGHRRDPFASFPIPQSGQVEWAADFFLQDYATMNASLYSDESGRNWLTGTLFPLALRSDMLFEALILSMARYSHPAGANALVPGGVHFAHLRSSVLGKLHRTLSQDKEISTSDTTIHTVICLIAADFFAGHDDHAATHLKGLQTLVSLRGGLEHGNFDRQTKYNLAGTHALCSFAEQRLQESSPLAVQPESELTYPKHPFSPQLCTEIATLPRGISDIALDGRISTQIIELLCRLAHMAQETPLTKRATTEEIYNVSVDLLTFITRTNLSPLERSVCIFCWLFVLREQPDRNESQKFYGQFLDNMRRRIKETATSFMSLEGAKPDYVTWGVAILVVEKSSERIGLTEDERAEVFEELIRRHPAARRWKETVKSLKRFFFLDAWVEEYRVWWNKEIGRCKRRSQEHERS